MLTKYIKHVYHENTVFGYYKASKFNAGQEMCSRDIPTLKKYSFRMFSKNVEFSFTCKVVESLESNVENQDFKHF